MNHHEGYIIIAVVLEDGILEPSLINDERLWISSIRGGGGGDGWSGGVGEGGGVLRGLARNSGECCIEIVEFNVWMEKRMGDEKM